MDPLKIFLEPFQFENQNLDVFSKNYSNLLMKI